MRPDHDWRLHSHASGFFLEKGSIHIAHGTLKFSLEQTQPQSTWLALVRSLGCRVKIRSSRARWQGGAGVVLKLLGLSSWQFLVHFVLTTLLSIRDLRSWLGVKSASPAVEARSLSHWTASEVPWHLLREGKGSLRGWQMDKLKSLGQKQFRYLVGFPWVIRYSLCVCVWMLLI